MRSSRYRRLCSAAILAAIAWLAYVPTITGQASEPDRSLGLHPGDAVRILVWRNQELSGEFEIVGDGTISHPLYRGVLAAGVSLPELEQRIRERILTFEVNPQFVVEPLYRVAVGGEVRLPGLYSFRPEVTVMHAVAQAGGLSERGRLDRVQVVREGRRVTLDLMDPDAEGGRMTVRSGDQIYVERRRDVFREMVAPVASVVGALAAVYRALRN